MDIAKGMSYAGLDVVWFGFWGFFEWQSKGRGLSGMMEGVDQVLLAFFSPTGVSSWGLGVGCTCETLQTF